MLRRIMISAGLGVVILLTLPSIHSSQRSTASERGKQLFLQYCASCHGTDGKGEGPAAAALRTPVPDLTKIVKQEGNFPRIRMQQIIAGEVGVTEIRAHGTRDMPVWGRVFRNRGDQSSSRLSVYALLKYIESIQQT